MSSRIWTSLGMALALTAFGHTATAAPVFESFLVEVVEGPGLGATGSLDIDYDDTSITGVGEEFLLSDAFSFILSIFGQAFTAEDDELFPDLPELFFEDGAIVALDFAVAEPGVGVGGLGTTQIAEPGIGGFIGFNIDGGVYTLSTDATVPAPGTMALLLLGLAATRGRRRAAA